MPVILADGDIPAPVGFQPRVDIRNVDEVTHKLFGQDVVGAKAFGTSGSRFPSLDLSFRGRHLSCLCRMWSIGDALRRIDSWASEGTILFFAGPATGATSGE